MLNLIIRAMENLKHLVHGGILNKYQKSLAIQEFEKLKQSNKNANEFIKDIANLLGMDTDGIGYDELQYSIDDFEEAIRQIYEFVYTDCIYESAMATISLHRTKKGAYRAMRNFLENHYAQWRDNNLKYGKEEFKFGMFEAWAIRPTILKD